MKTVTLCNSVSVGEEDYYERAPNEDQNQDLGLKVSNNDLKIIRVDWRWTGGGLEVELLQPHWVLWCRN